MYRPSVSLKGDLEFQAIDWVACDMKDDDDDNNVKDDNNSGSSSSSERRYVIRGYGATVEGNSVCINVKGFEPYFFVKIQEYWSGTDVSRFIAAMKTTIDKSKDIPSYSKYSAKNGLISAVIMMRKEFYGFTNNKLFKFVKLTFKNQNAFYTYRRILEKPIYISNVRYNFELYESNILPYLRFLHTQNINPVDWVKIPKGKYSVVDEKASRCQIEVNVKCTDVEGIQGCTLLAPFLVASFDIECTSKDGSFPQEKRKEDKVIQIGTTVHKYGTKECFLHYIATLGKADEISKEEVGAKQLIVEHYNTEKELLMGWAKFIGRLDPDVLIGYNIWGFDMKYLYIRAKLGNGGDVMPYHELFLQLLNRNKNQAARYEEKTLSSSALGDNMLKMITIEGVVEIDMLKVVQRDYKLASYKLDDVAAEFLKENKVDLLPSKIFANFLQGTPDKIKEIAVYCLKDCELVNRLLMKLETLANNIGMANVCIVPLSFLFVRGQGVKIFSLVSKQCREDGFLIKVVTKKEKDDSSYEGAIVFPPKPDIYMEPVGVDDFGSLYPSSMISENISHDSIVWIREYDNDKKMIAESGNFEYDGLSGFNYNDIMYDTFQEIKELDKKGRKKKKGKKVKIGYKICRYAEAKTGEKNVLPRILQKLLTARKDTRKKIEMRKITYRRGSETREFYGSVEKTDEGYPISKTDIIRIDEVVKVVDDFNDFQKKVLDGLQIAFKLTANSLYGQVGASTSPICYKELAASTTAVGRKMVCIARDTVLEKFPGSVLVYGDTDSVFINYMGYIETRHGKNLTDYEKLKYTAEYCAEGAALVTSKLKRPQTLNFEKILFPFIIFAKKRYVGNKYENSITKFKQINMGVVLKRRDNAKIVKEIFGGIINTILNERDIQKSKEFFRSSVVNLLEGKVDMSKLMISKSLKGDYVNPTQIAHKVLAERMGERDPGNKPAPSDRLPYCYIDIKNLRCLKCADKINADNCKCLRCMKLFCGKHLGNHRNLCNVVCRFCHCPTALECQTCRGWFCEEDMKKHYGRCTDKCEPIKGKCVKCNAANCKEKCGTCGCYVCQKDAKEHGESHKKCRDCSKTGAESLKMCETCLVMFCENHLIKHPNKCKKPIVPKLLQGDLIEHPQYIKDNDLKIDYRYYLDHQIQVPCLQIFSLIMRDPESLIEAAIRRDNNKKSGNTELTEWFKIIKVETDVSVNTTTTTRNWLDDDEVEEHFIDVDDEEPDIVEID